MPITIAAQTKSERERKTWVTVSILQDFQSL